MDRNVEWLLETGRFAASPAKLVSEVARRLCEDGFDLLRMNVQPRTLNVEVGSILYLWRPVAAPQEMRAGARVVYESVTQQEFGVVHESAIGYGGLGLSAFDTDAFRASPFYKIYAGTPRIRCAVVADAADYEFPILRDLAKAGATDYAAWPLRLGDGTVSAVSIVTRKTGGFTDTDISRFEALLDPLAMCVEIHLQKYIARSLLHTYLGRGPGEAVLAGRVQRGDVQQTEAAIWFSDLRGFTQASTAIEPRELVAWLNEYFGAIAKPISANGGEILKFIGDAILAVFPVTEETTRQAACEAALRSAEAANGALDALNENRSARGLPALQHGIGLHVGTVEYGNIGAERRLDFTVIGRAVNLASRIESLCGKLSRRTLASADLAALAGRELPTVGSFELKGLPGEQVVYAL